MDGQRLAPGVAGQQLQALVLPNAPEATRYFSPIEKEGVARWWSGLTPQQQRGFYQRLMEAKPRPLESGSTGWSLPKDIVQYQMIRDAAAERIRERVREWEALRQPKQPPKDDRVPEEEDSNPLNDLRKILRSLDFIGRDLRRAIRSLVFRLGLKVVPGLRNTPGLDQIPAITDWLTELILGKETAERERAEDEALALELLGPQGMRALEIAEAVIDIRDLLKKGGPIRGGIGGPGGPRLGVNRGPIGGRPGPNAPKPSRPTEARRLRKRGSSESLESYRKRLETERNAWRNIANDETQPPGWRDIARQEANELQQVIDQVAREQRRRRACHERCDKQPQYEAKIGESHAG